MKKIFLISLLIFSPIFAEENFEAEDMYSNALEQYNSGNFDEAIKIFKDLKKKGYKNQYIYNSMLDAYIAKLRNYKGINSEKDYFNVLNETLNIAREAFNLYPDNVQIAYKYIFILDETANLNEMQKPIQVLLKNNKNDIVANFYYGVTEYYNKNYKSAEIYFKKVTELSDYKNEMEYFILYKALFNLGQLELEKQNFFNAIEYYEKAKNIFPMDYKLLINLGLCYAEVLEGGKAIEIFKKIPTELWGELLYEIYGGMLFFMNDNSYIDFSEKYWNESLYLTALRLYKNQKYEESLKKLNELTKNMIAPHFLIHYLYFANYDKLNKKDMANKEAFLIAKKAEMSGKLEIAIKYYEYIEKNNTGKPSIYWIIANLYNDIKDYKKAIEYYTKYISDPEAKDYISMSYMKLSYIYHQQKDYNKSKEYLKKAQETAESDDEKQMINFYAGLIYYNEKKYNEAIKEFEKVLTFSSEDPKTLFFIGASYFEMKNNKKAIEYLEKAYQIKDNDPEINNLLAYVYSIEKIKLEEAHKIVDKALIIKPDNIAYLDTKGWIYYNQEDYKKSFEVFNKVEAIINSTNENTIGFDEIYYHLSKIYEKMGNKKEAQKYIEKIKKNFPDSKWASQTVEKKKKKN